jgi:hypothetical protein
MTSVRLYDLVKNRVLVSRESARAIEPALGSALADGRGQVELNFDGVEGMTPSFLDEILAIIEERLGAAGSEGLRIMVVNPPTRLSSKFVALGRGRQLSVKESDDGAWAITRNGQGDMART